MKLGRCDKKGEPCWWQPVNDVFRRKKKKGMKNKTYTSMSADTSGVQQLSEELMKLTEEMARNVHDV